MTALQITQEEIGNFDPATYQRVRSRLGYADGPKAVSRELVRPFSVAYRAAPPTPPPPSDEFTRYVDKDLTFDLGDRGAFPPKRRSMSIRIQEIQKVVCEVHGISLNDLCSARRAKELVRARQEAFWLCRKYTRRSLPEIGRYMGGRDHTTVLHGVRKLDSMLARGAYEILAAEAVAGLVAQIESSRCVQAGEVPL